MPESVVRAVRLGQELLVISLSYFLQWILEKKKKIKVLKVLTILSILRWHIPPLITRWSLAHRCRSVDQSAITPGLSARGSAVLYVISVLIDVFCVEKSIAICQSEVLISREKLIQGNQREKILAVTGSGLVKRALVVWGKQCTNKCWTCSAFGGTFKYEHEYTSVTFEAFIVRYYQPLIKLIFRMIM